MGMLNDAPTEVTTDNALIIVMQIDPGLKGFCVGYLGNSVVIISKQALV